MDRVEDVLVDCPWCGEVFGILVDTTHGTLDMVEDCSVCCRPIAVTVEFRDGEVAGVSAERG